MRKWLVTLHWGDIGSLFQGPQELTFVGSRSPAGDPVAGNQLVRQCGGDEVFNRDVLLFGDSRGCLVDLVRYVDDLTHNSIIRPDQPNRHLWC